MEGIIQGVTVGLLLWGIKEMVSVSSALAVHKEKHESHEKRLDKLENGIACHK